MSESASVMSRPIVCARLRPIIEEDYRQANVVKAAPHVCVHFKKDGQTIKILQDDLTQKLFRLDYTFDVSATQTEVYNTVVRPIVQDVLRGCNGTVLAYGPTAAGKSYTIFGSETKLGVTQFAINDIFDRIQQYEESERVAKVYVTFYQIYMDQIYDLLRVDEELQPLTLREQDGKPLIENLHQLFIKDRDTALEVVRQGLLNRRSYSTNFNMRSSRSHAILQFHIDLEDDEPDNDYDRTHGAGSLHQHQQHRAHEEEKRSSSDAKTPSKPRDTSDTTAATTYHVRRRTMTFVDLAGSERLSPHKPASKLVVAETTSINKSIAELSHCLHVMANGGDAASQSGQSHIPLRNSKLTRILIPALSSTSPSLQRSGSTQRSGTHTQRYGGGAGTTRSLIIANVNPCAYALDETLSTMKFATRVKQIRNLSRSSSPSKVPTTPTPTTVHAAERLSMFSSAATDHHHHHHLDDHEDALAATTISSHPTAPRTPALTLMSPHGTAATTSATAGHISPLTTTSTAPHHMHHSYGSPTVTPAMDTEALRSSSIAVDAATTPTPPPSNAHSAAQPSFNLREFLRACTIANRLAQTQQFLAQQEAAAAAQREQLHQQQQQQQQRASRPDETAGDDEDAASRGQRLFMSGAATPPPPPLPSQAPASTFNSFPSPAFTIKSLDSDALRLIHSRDSHDAAENETSPMPPSRQFSKQKKQLESRGMVAIKPALSLTVDENDANNDDDSDDDSFAGGHRTFEAGLRGTLGADSTPLLAHDVADVSPGLLPGLDKHLSLLSPSASGSFFFADASASATAGGGAAGAAGAAGGGNVRAANASNAAAALSRPSTMAARRPPPLQQPLSRTSSMRSVESFRLMQGSEYHAFKQHQQQQQQQHQQQAQGQSQTSPEHPSAAAAVSAEDSPAGPPTPSAATAAAARARLERQAAKNSQQSTPVTAPASASSTPSAQQRYAQMRQQQSAFTFDVPDTATTTAGTNSDSTAATATTATSPTTATVTNTSPPPRRTPTMQQFTQKLAQQTAQSVLALPADALPATPGGGTVASTAAGFSPHPAGSYQSIRRVIRRVEMTTQTDPPPTVHDKSIQTLSGLHPVAAPMKKLYLGQLDDFDEFVPAPPVDQMTQTEAIFLVSDYYGSIDEQRELTNLALLDPLEVACCFLELKKVVETQAEQIARLQELILNGDR